MALHIPAIHAKEKTMLIDSVPALDVLPSLIAADGVIYIEVRAPEHLLDKPEHGSRIYRAWLHPRDPDFAAETAAIALAINKVVPSALNIGINPRQRRRTGPGWVEEVRGVALRVEPGASMATTEGLNQLQRLVTPTTVWGAPPEGSAFMYFAFEEPAHPDDVFDVLRRVRGVLGLPGTTVDDPMVPLPGSLFWMEGGHAKPMEFVAHEPAARTTLRALEAAADAMSGGRGATEQGTAGQRTSGPGDVGQGTPRPRRLPLPQPEPWSEEQTSLLEQILPQKIQDHMLVGFRKGGHYRTPAKADMAVIRHLASAGLTDGQIVHAFERNPRGLGWNAAGMDPHYLSRLIQTIRTDMADQSQAFVMFAKGSDDPRRIYLCLRIVSGPHKGLEYNQGISIGSSVQQWVFRSAGFEAPTFATLKDYRKLRGQTVAVDLKEEGGQVLVRKWLAAKSLEPLPFGPDEPPRPEAPLPEPPPLTTYPLVEAPPPPEERRPRLDAALDRLETVGIPVDPVRWRLATQRAIESWLTAWVATGDEVERRRILAKMRTLSNVASEVLWQAKEAGRACCRWEGHHAWAGRLHAHQPPLQQIAKILRWAFVAPPGRTLIVADWSNAQARILAALSGDVALIAALSDPDRDPYTELGAWVLELLAKRGGQDDGDVDARGLGKAIFLPALFFAGIDELQPKVESLGLTLTKTDAGAIHGHLREQFPRLARWREEQRATTRFLSPLGRLCVLPRAKYDKYGKPDLPAIVAGIAQSFESDALRLVLGWTEQHLGGIGVRIVMVVHDEVVFEVDEEQADEAAGKIRALMEAALGLVCNVAEPGRFCPPRVGVEVRQAWGEDADKETGQEDDDDVL